MQKDDNTTALKMQLPAKKNGGGKRDRTDDLLVANQALSQLSYTPDIKLIALSYQQTAIINN